MAAWRDLEGRVMQMGGTALYFGVEPKWLANARRAAAAGPVILNIKGVMANDVPCIVPLAELERLQRLAGTRPALEGATADELAILAPDRAEITADN